MIPARLGSKRVKNKNLRPLGGKPLIQYVIDSVKKTKLFDKILLILKLKFLKKADNNELYFYKRPISLDDTATNDEFVEDFLNHIDCKNIFQILPTSPFITSNDIHKFYNYFFDKSCHTLVSQKEVRIECTYLNLPINFDSLSRLLLLKI